MHIATSKEKDRRKSHRRMALYAHLSEAVLLKLARSNDAGAFEELVGRSVTMLYGVAMRYVRNESDAQEILQNSYISAWQNLPNFEGRARFESWMYRITANASLMFLRTRSRQKEVAINDVEPMVLKYAIGQAAKKVRSREDWACRPDEEYQSIELRRVIEIAANSLPERLKSVFLLRDMEELTTEDTANELGISIPAAKTRLYRARRALRESLDNYVEC
jgi:RNA polymerase sigma-70 factor (ECF subfamily)